MTYNLTGIADNSTTIVGFMQGVNSELMLGFGGVMLLVGLYVVIFLGFLYSTNNGGKALVASSFIGLVLTVLMAAMGLVPNMAILISLILAAACVAFVRTS